MNIHMKSTAYFPSKLMNLLSFQAPEGITWQLSQTLSCWKPPILLSHSHMTSVERVLFQSMVNHITTTSEATTAHCWNTLVICNISTGRRPKKYMELQFLKYTEGSWAIRVQRSSLHLHVCLQCWWVYKPE